MKKLQHFKINRLFVKLFIFIMLTKHFLETELVELHFHALPNLNTISQT